MAENVETHPTKRAPKHAKKTQKPKDCRKNAKYGTVHPHPRKTTYQTCQPPTAKRTYRTQLHPKPASETKCLYQASAAKTHHTPPLKGVTPSMKTNSLKHFKTKEAKLSWITGIIDGEGCLTTQVKKTTLRDGTKRNYYYLVLKVGNTHKHTIDALYELSDQKGKIYNSIQNNKPYYTWHLHNEEAIELMLEIENYSVNKYFEIQIAKKFIEVSTEEEKETYHKLLAQQKKQKEELILI